MKTPSNKIKAMADFYRQNNVSIEDIILDVVESCATLCERHSAEMHAYCFDSKADTAYTCAGIMQEAFGIEREITEN